MIGQNQNGIRINLEFAIIVTMALLILSFNFYQKNKIGLFSTLNNIFYQAIIFFSILVLGFAVVYNLVCCFKISKLILSWRK